MNPSDLAAQWTTAFGPFPPLGYICREHLHDRWLRIHNLPESKRYPDCEAEYAELLRRHNEVATTVLGNGEPCVLFVASYGDAPIIATPVIWQPHAFDHLIRAVADEDHGPALFANIQHRTAYAPYDGGADFFLDSPESASWLKRQWASWLSSRADGL